MRIIKKTRKLFTAFTAVLLVVCLSATTAFAVVPGKPANGYVLDNADVISSETENSIISKNNTLFQSTGAQLAVVSVDFIDGNSSADYTYEIFNSWGIGSKERNNGLLLMFATAENKVWAMAGSGIDKYFSGSVLEDMLQDTFYKAYDNKEYDKAVKQFTDAAFSKFDSYYKTYTDEYTNNTSFSNGGVPTTESRSSGSSKSSLFVFMIMFIVIVIISSSFRSRRRYYGGGGGGFWSGMFFGSMMNNHRRRPPPGGFGGGGFGGFSGGGGSRGGGSGRGGFGGGGFGGGGGFSGGGGSSGGGAGR